MLGSKICCKSRSDLCAGDARQQLSQQLDLLGCRQGPFSKRDGAIHGTDEHQRILSGFCLRHMLSGGQGGSFGQLEFLVCKAVQASPLHIGDQRCQGLSSRRQEQLRRWR